MRKNQTRNKKGIVKEAFTMALLAVSIMILAAACGSSSGNEVPDLRGTWQSQNNDGSYQEAVITGDTIEINWVSDNGATKSIYWAGTYTAPSEATDTYEWTSERDKEKTDSALLASGDDSKVFTYSNGKLSYEVSALGTTTTLELTKQ